ncbi:nitrite reductase large subunit NirB [Ectobacillus panaciterrae]|uniref:nitrite reductase large subunit NirB n=1 Tax=Ectobacillus panaciterrae TaxID=363872 RepID=UPI00041E7336|nr:nitrite reductase large subunit NirB [Ectobacillus panaciterrae]
MGKKQLVLVGNGMAGVRCIEEILRIDRESFEITIFGSEPHPNYNRILLSKVLQGDTSIEDITINDWDWYKENHIQLFTGEKVIRIDTEQQMVYSDLGREVPYDELIIATGSIPFMPPVPGADQKGVTAFRDIHDCEMMLEAAKTYKKAAVIGGGLLGLEAARGLLNLGMSVDVVHIHPYLMERQLDQTASKLLQKALEEQGMNFLLAKETERIFGGERVKGLRFKDGTRTEADLVVMAVGVRPNVSLAKSSSIEVNRAIVVNDYLQTNIPHVYAVGECAEHRGAVYGLVAPLYEQAKVLARKICNMDGDSYEGSIVSTQLKVSGVDVFSAGEIVEQDGMRSLKVYDEINGIYKKILVKEDTIVGAVLFGDSSEGTELLGMIHQQANISRLRKVSVLQSWESAESSGESRAASMPHHQIVCTCNGVSKGAIVEAIEKNGLSTVEQVKSCTKASSSCGGCKPLVNAILDHTLRCESAEEKETICGCTSLSRDEVMQEIKEKQLTHVREVMNVLGWKSEEGCSVCRPALNYYLGVIYPVEYTDEEECKPLNERMYANLQVDGTYSVVPRMYGGITNAQELRRIADVVEKYQVPMVKLTGGQRMDLLGVKKEDLPRVWEDLDMPSGNSYAKAVRTVKTCVGALYCRFGTQDSIRLGIALEKKFERLQTPHKVKMAVSACPRNCAESGIKDFGVVGVDGGWELYIGGNGGTHLQAGQLLCTVTTEEEVLEMAGAFLQYYRETANYLERTSKWTKRLGLEHIREVLFDQENREELVDRMKLAVSRVNDPWKEVLTNKDRKQKFIEISQ